MTTITIITDDNKTPTTDDDSDGELFIEDSRDRGGSSAGNAYTVNAPSVYRAPSLPSPLASAPGVPNTDSGEAAKAGEQDEGGGYGLYGESGDGVAGGVGGGTAGAGAGDTSRQAGAPAGGGMHESMSSHRAVAGDSSVEMFPSGAGGVAKGGLRLGPDGRVASIPRDGSTLDVSCCCFGRQLGDGVGGGLCRFCHLGVACLARLLLAQAEQSRNVERL